MAFYSSKNSFSIIAEIDTYTPSKEGFQYPYNIKFISSDATTINKNYLEVPTAENWEMGVTSVNYKVINSKTILVPTPTHAKTTNVYDLYAGEILFGPMQFFPIQYPTKDCIRLKNEDNVDLHRFFTKDAYKITDPGHLWRAKGSFGPLMNMYDRLYIGMFDSGVTPLQRSEFYARDMNTPAGQPVDPDLLAEIKANKDNIYYIDLSSYHSPILRWNFTDILFSLFPKRFTLHSNTYGLFSLDELWTAPVFSDPVLANAQSLLDNKKVLGFVKADQIQERHFYANIRNGLPKFAVVKSFAELKNTASEKLQPHCTIKTPPTCMYIAMGDTICKLSGYHKIRDTYELTTKTKYRKKLGIIINTMEDAFIGSCSIKWAGGGYPRIVPVFHHDGEEGAEQQSSRRQWLWKLPATNTYSDNADFYYWIQDPGRGSSDDRWLTRTIESHNALQFFNAGELFIYCDNSIEATSHIGNYISPLLDKIPAPSFAFSKTLINTSYIDFSTDQISTQLDIKNPIFKSLKPRINLADAQAQILNEYGEPVFCGILTLELVARRKGTQ